MGCRAGDMARCGLLCFVPALLLNRRTGTPESAAFVGARGSPIADSMAPLAHELSLVDLNYGARAWLGVVLCAVIGLLTDQTGAKIDKKTVGKLAAVLAQCNKLTYLDLRSKHAE